MKLRVLFHVYNISGYLIAELEELSKHAEIAVIETPCRGIGKGVLEKTAKWIDRRKYSSGSGLEQALGGFKPDIFFCGGWADEQCLGLAKALHKKGTKTVLLVDTPWQGRMKQIVHCLYSRFYLTPIFDFAWCAGAPQERYLRYLGFPLSRIRRGYYCADTKKFAPIGEERLGVRKVGRGREDWRRRAEQKVDEWLVGVTKESFGGALDRLIDEKVATGEYRFKRVEDQPLARAGARRFFDEFSRKIIQLSDGRYVYFSPDVRSRIRNGSDLSRCWAEYAFHAVSNGGSRIEGKEYNERWYNSSKAVNLNQIVVTLQQEKCFVRLRKDARIDSILFAGQVVSGMTFDVITRLDEYGNVEANLTEVTFEAKTRGEKKLPRLVPLAEAVQAVVHHQNTAGSNPQNIGSVANSDPSCKCDWPHVFLYIGRYAAVKNMRRMERAFIKAVEKVRGGEGEKVRPWVLRCIGGGELWDERTIHPRIEHLGYKSPDEIQNYVQDAGCFVLPSIYEPWGVVVHEAALMGLPMLCSTQIQAATAYLKDGENGFSFDPLDEDAMTSVFLKVMRMADKNLVRMGRESFELGMSYKNNDWARTVLEMMK